MALVKERQEVKKINLRLLSAENLLWKINGKAADEMFFVCRKVVYGELSARITYNLYIWEVFLLKISPYILPQINIGDFSHFPVSLYFYAQLISSINSV